MEVEFSTGVKDHIVVTGVHKVLPEGVQIYSQALKRKVGIDPETGRDRYLTIPFFLRTIHVDWIVKYNGRRVKTMTTQMFGQEDESSEMLRLMTGEEASMATRKAPVRKGSTAAKRQAAAAAKKAAPAAKKPAVNSGLTTKTRKSLDDMSDAHRDHINKWEPHLDALRGEHVWASVMRVPGRNADGPCYVALKRGPKDYVIVDYDTAAKPAATPKRVLEDGFESSSALMESFKEYRQRAKQERADARPKPAAKKTATKRKAPAKKTTVTKVKPSRTTAAKMAGKPTRKRAPRK